MICVAWNSADGQLAAQETFKEVVVCIHKVSKRKDSSRCGAQQQLQLSRREEFPGNASVSPMKHFKLIKTIHSEATICDFWCRKRHVWMHSTVVSDYFSGGLLLNNATLLTKYPLFLQFQKHHRISIGGSRVLKIIIQTGFCRNGSWTF